MKSILDEKDIKAVKQERDGIERRIWERYFNLFASSWDWGGFAREEREFIIRSLWDTGRISSLRISDELLAFVSYAPNEFNIYNAPVGATPIPNRPANYIPQRVLRTGALRTNVARHVDEPEIVLGWAMHSLRPISDALKDWIDDLVEVEMAIRINTDLQKIPFAIKTTPQNESKLKLLLKRLIYGVRGLAVGVDEIGSIEAMATGAPYILDKLEERKDHLDKEVLTFLGIDNLKEKPERMQGDEINANNDEINLNQDAILDNVKEWVALTNKAFGTNYSVEAKRKTRSLYEKEEGESKEDKDDGNGME